MTDSSYVEERTALLARTGTTGAGQRAALSRLTDRWLASLLPEVPGLALVAVGGYGRAELSPGSDLDVLLVHDGRRGDIDALATRIWYPVWDTGVQLDHSVRTLGEALSVFRDDLRAAMGMLPARHVAGDAELGTAVREQALAIWRGQATRRLPELVEATRARAQVAGEVAFLLEPDLKEARGGLRDVHALQAVAAAWVADRPGREVLAAYDRLLDVRDRLQTVSGRATNRLLLQEQDEVAATLGLADADALMHQVADAGRTVAYAVDLAFRRVAATRPSRRPFRRGPAVTVRRPLADGVVEQDGEVVLARDVVAEEDPVLLLRTAAAAAQAALPPAPMTLERLRGCPPLPEPWPTRAREELVRLLGAGPPVVPVVEALDQAGLMTRLLPEWASVRSRPQRNALHVHTVDRHIVEVVAQAGALTRRVHRPDLLLVGALLHDIGKGQPGDHSAVGAVMAAVVAERMGFEPADVQVLRRLVAHHLLLAQVATRRDLDDPGTVRTVTRAIHTQEELELLAALTEADSRATGAAVWGPWKAGLVASLVGRVGAVLGGGSPAAPPAVDVRRRAAADGSGVVVHVGDGEVVVGAPDRPGLLWHAAAVLTVHRLTVRSATVTSAGGRAVDVFVVAPEFGEMPDPLRLEEDLRTVLESGGDVEQRLARREAAYPGRPAAPVADPQVLLLDDASVSATVLEVRAHDRVGLLARVAQAIAEAGMDVRNARVTTLGAEAVDAFYVTAADGSKVNGTAARAELTRRVLTAIG